MFKFHPLEKTIKIHPLGNKLFSLLTRSGDMQSIFRVFPNLGFITKGETVLFFHNPDVPVFTVISYELPEAYLFFIKNFIPAKLIDLETAYQLLFLSEEIPLTAEKMMELLLYLPWPAGPKGMDYYSSFKLFSAYLQSLVFNKQVGLKEAYQFHCLFKNNYDDFLHITNNQLTYSEMTEMIKNVVEYSIRENKTIRDLKNICADLTGVELKSLFKKLRFPLYSEYNDQFSAYIKKLKLPKPAVINYDRNFEKSDFTLQFKFKDFATLFHTAVQLKKTLEQYQQHPDFIDNFNPEIFFKK